MQAKTPAEINAMNRRFWAFAIEAAHRGERYRPPQAQPQRTVDAAVERTEVALGTFRHFGHRVLRLDAEGAVDSVVKSSAKRSNTK